MLNRQKIILLLLRQANKSLDSLVFIKFAFLLREETIIKYLKDFYNFLPYKYGPFSFTLYRELEDLENNGYIKRGEDSICLLPETINLVDSHIGDLPQEVHQAVSAIINSYSKYTKKDILTRIYNHYSWYAINSELQEFLPENPRKLPKAKIAIYTLGYEGKSIDIFYNSLLKVGIKAILDIRANPISRKYGYSKKKLSEFSNNLGMKYYHFPSLGIPSDKRRKLSSYDSYQRLLDNYEHNVLPKADNDLKVISSIIKKQPAALMCFEKDVTKCHRSRLAEEIAKRSSIEIINLP